MGLLKPDHVVPSTGYRYYSAEQLPRLNQIVAFKDLGFSLEQIIELLNDKIPPAQIRGMLRLKQAEVQQHIESEQTRLRLIEARLQQIEQSDSVSLYNVILKQAEAQSVAAIRDILPLPPLILVVFISDFPAFRISSGLRRLNLDRIIDHPMIG